MGSTNRQCEKAYESDYSKAYRLKCKPKENCLHFNSIVGDCRKYRKTECLWATCFRCEDYKLENYHKQMFKDVADNFRNCIEDSLENSIFFSNNEQGLKAELEELLIKSLESFFSDDDYNIFETGWKSQPLRIGMSVIYNDNHSDDVEFDVDFLFENFDSHADTVKQLHKI